MKLRPLGPADVFHRLLPPRWATTPIVMSSQPRGKGTSGIEVTDISPHGIWVLVHGEELFLPYEQFPWFKRGSVEAVLKVEEQSPGHYYWPELDVDLSIESMRNPDQYPLSFNADS